MATKSPVDQMIEEHYGSEDMPWLGQVHQSAQDYRMDPLLIRAIGKVESGEDPGKIGSPINGDPNVRAKGYMQLHPNLVKQYSVGDPLDYRANIHAGARYLAESLHAEDGDLINALMRYHGGPNRENWGEKTSAYPYKILDAYKSLGGDPDELRQAYAATSGIYLPPPEVPPPSPTAVAQAQGALGIAEPTTTQDVNWNGVQSETTPAPGPWQMPEQGRGNRLASAALLGGAPYLKAFGATIGDVVGNAPNGFVRNDALRSAFSSTQHPATPEIQDVTPLGVATQPATKAWEEPSTFQQAVSMYKGQDEDFANKHPGEAAVLDLTGSMATALPLIAGSSILGPLAARLGVTAETGRPMVGAANFLLRRFGAATVGGEQGALATVFTAGLQSPAERQKSWEEQLARGAATGAGINVLAGPLLGAIFGRMFGSNIDPRMGALVEDASRLGVPINTAQVPGAPWITNKLYSVFHSGDPEHVRDLYRSFSHQIGENTEHLNTANIEGAKRRIGRLLDARVAGHEISNAGPEAAFGPGALRGDLYNIGQDVHQTLGVHLPGTAEQSAYTQVRSLLNSVDSRFSSGTGLSGEQFRDLTKYGGPLSTALHSNNPLVSQYAWQIREALHNAMMRQLHPNDTAMYNLNMQWYRNAVVLGKVADQTKDFNPALVAGALEQSMGNRAATATGATGDFNTLAQVGRHMFAHGTKTGLALPDWINKGASAAATLGLGYGANVLGATLPMAATGAGAGLGAAYLASKALNRPANALAQALRAQEPWLAGRYRNPYLAGNPLIAGTIEGQTQRREDLPPDFGLRTR